MFVIFDDVQLVVGQQEANFGQVSKGTATETSIAESSRMSAIGANIDDLDSFMSEITRAAGQVLLLEMSKDEVIKIVGEGAVWPEFLREDILNEIQPYSKKSSVKRFLPCFGSSFERFLTKIKKFKIIHEKTYKEN